MRESEIIILSNRLKLGQTEIFCDVVPCHFHPHVAHHLIGIAAGDVCEQMGPLLKFDDPNHIRELILESGVIGDTVNHKRIDFSSAR